MQLEQSLYEPIQESEKKSFRVYQVGDLENLSATALHYGEGGSSGFVGGGFGGISKKDLDKYGIVGMPSMKIPKIQPNQNLTIRDFPASGFQLHIHEGAGGTAHIWDYKRKNKIEINSYDAAMAELLAGRPYIQKILKEHGII